MGTPRVLLSDAEQHTLGLVRSHIEKIMKQLLGNKYKVNVEQLVGAL
ncbi:hypothetical protein CEB3_c00060 [Peptococcaceae bacterium CEB3]|nr:hypothetical protein CEB3_c00060 [Peptococcaceae bacterium CEB3]